MSEVFKRSDLEFLKSILPLNEIEYGRFLHSLYPESSKAEIVAGMAVIHHLQEGHIAIDAQDFKDYDGRKLLKLPEESFLSLLGEVVGIPGEKKMLTLENGLLYLQKNWHYEQELSDWLIAKSKQEVNLEKDVKILVDGLFGESDSNLNFQKVAVKLALLKQLAVISGGPGTGKTYTVQKIVEAYRALHGEEKVIALAAPTGKAAQRLNDSMGETIDQFNLQPARTIHSLLGAKGDSGTFSKNKSNPLDVDVLVVDEASMLDLSLWVAVIRALPSHTKLVVLGDRFQLASVEAGYILGDICGNSDNGFSGDMIQKMGEDLSESSLSSFNDCVVTLTKSYRFDGNSGIQNLADAIKDEDASKALAILDSSDFPDVQLQSGKINQNTVLKEFVLEPFRAMKHSEDRFSILNSHRVLNAMRVGKSGVEQWNRDAEHMIRNYERVGNQVGWYDGRPVIITKNDPFLGIRNGEVGIYNASEGSVVFEGELNSYKPSRLSNYEPAYCLTVHKSQGSEYNNVAIVLPNVSSGLLSKELLYTAVTRARQNVLIVGTKEVIAECITNPTVRKGGLRRKIWGR